MTRAHHVLTRLQSARRQLEQIEHRDLALRACIVGLARLEALLSRPPRVVILGEVNSGKTSLADLLLGMRLLPASVIANTRLPLLIHHSETVTLHTVGSEGRRLLDASAADALAAGMRIDRLEIGLPNDRLKEFEIVDTPAVPDAEKQGSTGDIRIWCTVATRAWTESERALWSALPRRNWRNALLVATHKDALETASDAAKIEWRLRAAAGDMFRDVVLVSAHDVSSTPGDVGAAVLLEQVRAWAAEIQDRRALKVEKLARHLARLTLHRLVRVPLKTSEARIVKDWEIDCARLISRLDDASGDLVDVLQQLLRRFAHASDLASPGSIGGDGRWSAPTETKAQGRSLNGPGARRYARLIAADLTMLLRKELANVGPRDASLFAEHEAATTALLPIARLDTVFDELGAMLLPKVASERQSEFEPSELRALAPPTSTGLARFGR